MIVASGIVVLFVLMFHIKFICTVYCYNTRMSLYNLRYTLNMLSLTIFRWGKIQNYHGILYGRREKQSVVRITMDCT